MRGLLVMFALLFAASAARGETLSLEEAERRARASGAAWDTASRTAEAQAELELARLGHRPTLALSADASGAPGGSLVDVQSADGQHFLVQGSKTLGEPGTFTPVPRYGTMLSVQASLLDFGRTSARIEAAAHRVRAAQADSRVTYASVKRAVREAYVAWAAAEARLSLAGHRQRDGAGRLASAVRLVEEGARPRAGLTAEQEEEVALELELVEAQAVAARSRADLERVMGSPLAASSIPEANVLDAGAGDLPAASAPEALALDERAAAAVATASLVRSRAPVLSTSGEAGVRGQASSLFPLYRLGLVLTVPLWDGGVAEAQARAALTEAAAQRAGAEATRTAREIESRLARDELSIARQRVELAGRARALAEQSLSEAEHRHELGGSDVRPVLDARERLSRAEGAELAARAERAAVWLGACP